MNPAAGETVAGSGLGELRSLCWQGAVRSHLRELAVVYQELSESRSDRAVYVGGCGSTVAPQSLALPQARLPLRPAGDSMSQEGPHPPSLCISASVTV